MYALYSIHSIQIKPTCIYFYDLCYYVIMTHRFSWWFCVFMMPSGVPLTHLHFVVKNFIPHQPFTHLHSCYLHFGIHDAIADVPLTYSRFVVKISFNTNLSHTDYPGLIGAPLRSSCMHLIYLFHARPSASPNLSTNIRSIPISMIILLKIHFY